MRRASRSAPAPRVTRRPRLRGRRRGRGTSVAWWRIRGSPRAARGRCCGCPGAAGRSRGSRCCSRTGRACASAVWPCGSNSGASARIGSPQRITGLDLVALRHRVAFRALVAELREAEGGDAGAGWVAGAVGLRRLRRRGRGRQEALSQTRRGAGGEEAAERVAPAETLPDHRADGAAGVGVAADVLDLFRRRFAGRFPCLRHRHLPRSSRRLRAAARREPRHGGTISGIQLGA